MGNWSRRTFWVLGLASFALAQPAATHGATQQSREPNQATATSKLQGLLEAKVKAEWEAFKNKDKRAYSDLLADDFVAIEDDGQGMRNKAAASGEIDRSVVNSYNLFAFTVLPLNANA